MNSDRFILAALLFAAPALAGAGERAFWVWNRADPLTGAETETLHAARVDHLYWQAGELELRGGKLTFVRTAVLPAGDPWIVPVVRVSTAIRSPEQFTGEALGAALRPIVDAAPGREVQLDFDCPDRLLSVYAEHLRTARKVAGIRRLTITALAGWADAPAAAALWPAVDAVFPMLYDTALDPAPVNGSPQPRPLLDPAVLAAQIRGWSRCPVPWQAGLPTFARVTAFDATGRSKGHLRSWDWEDLVFNPALTLDRPNAGGGAVLRATKATRAGNTPLPEGGFVALRGVDLAAVRAGAVATEAAGARGVVYFRLPDPPSLGRGSGGPSLTQILAPAEATPRLALHRAGDVYTLRNDSDADLPPRFDPPNRGYALELEIAGGQPGGWREAQAGDFHRVAAHVVRAGETPQPVAIPLASRLSFWFAELPAHGSLAAGLVQLAPGIDPGAIRFRLADPNNPSIPWQTPD